MADKLRSRRPRPEPKRERYVSPTLLHAEMPLYDAVAEGVGQILFGEAGRIEKMRVRLPVPARLVFVVESASGLHHGGTVTLDAGHHQLTESLDVADGDVLTLTVVPKTAEEAKVPLRALFAATFVPKKIRTAEDALSLEDNRK